MKNRKPTLAVQRNLATLCSEHKLIAHPHVRGLADCKVPDFEPSTYKGLSQNCGKPKPKTTE